MPNAWHGGSESSHDECPFPIPLNSPRARALGRSSTSEDAEAPHAQLCGINQYRSFADLSAPDGIRCFLVPWLGLGSATQAPNSQLDCPLRLAVTVDSTANDPRFDDERLEAC